MMGTSAGVHESSKCSRVGGGEEGIEERAKETR